MNFKIGRKLLLSLILAFGLVGYIYADNVKIANITITSESISIQGIEGYSNVLFKVSGPNGFYVENYLGNETISMVIDDFSTLKDGSYNYELTASTGEIADGYKQNLQNGRDGAPGTATEGVSQSGSFVIQNGQVLTSDRRIRNFRMVTEGADQDEA